MEPDSTDRRLRQLMGEMAATAPPPPALDERTIDAAVVTPSGNRHRMQLAAAAAVVLILALVALAVSRGSDDSQLVASGGSASDPTPVPAQCPPGFPVEQDTTGDDVAHNCYADPSEQPNAAGDLGCPADFPLERDTTGDGVSNACFAEPHEAGGSGCPALFPAGVDTTGDGVVDTCYANVTPTQGADGGVTSVCPPERPVEVDTTADGAPDACFADPDLGQPDAALQSPCPPGFPVGRDTTGDGLLNACFAEPNGQPNAAGDSACPATFPAGVDTNGDGQIDTCYQDLSCVTPACRPTTEAVECIAGAAGEGSVGVDLQFDAVVVAYNRYDADTLVRIVGDGPVIDVSLDPEGDGEYTSIAEWLATAASVGDQIETAGYGYYEPFELFVTRSNNVLAERDVTSLSLTLEFWLNQDCETRVSTSDAVSAPDPCWFYEAFELEAPSACAQAFAPRAGHIAVWTGDELLVYGGLSGTYDGAGLATGFAYDPADNTVRDLPPSPLVMSTWPALHGFWSGDSLVVVGHAGVGDRWQVIVQTYVPATGEWLVGSPLPDETAQLGGVVWTGRQVIIAGGEQNTPDDRAWAYTPATDEWVQLPDPELNPVEGMAGVWTESEAIFVGGTTRFGSSQGVAYSPTTGTWRRLPPRSTTQSLQGHEVFWTGEVLIVASGHAGPGHPQRLSVYDPAADGWTLTSAVPIPAAETLGAAWTGTELIIWGGYGTYGPVDDDGDTVYGEGAAYDPVTDSWRVLADSPLSDRCAHSGTWTGSAFVVIGGLETCGSPNVLPRGDGASYDFVTDSWTELSPE